MEPLEGIGVRDFLKAMRDPTHAPEEIEQYQRGVFAEWEAVPDWFKEIVSQELE